LIFQRQLPTTIEINAALAAEILDRSERAPSHPSHNQGGWRSGDDLLDWPLVVEIGLVGFVRSGLWVALDDRPTITKAWAVVNRRGSYHGRHRHTARWSAIYYVTTGGASTIFESSDGEFKIEPVAGLLTIFPSELWHRTEPHFEDAPRITIAFDAS
jgi:hypothetical protein